MANEGEILFSAKYKDWIAVKKKTIDDKTEDKEIIAILSSISNTTARKAFDFSGINKSIIEEYAAKLTRGKRKGLSNLVTIFSELKQNELKENLLKACPKEELLPIAEAYFMNCVLSNLAYSTSVTIELLSKIYPDLKLPKPRGRRKK